MIEQCEKCELYNSLGCPYCGVGAADSSDCDEFRPNEENKITDPIKRQLFKLLKDSPSLNVLYEEQWTESVEYLVSNGVTIKCEVAREIFEKEIRGNKMTILELVERDLKKAEINLEKAKAKPNITRSELEHTEELYRLRALIVDICKSSEGVI